MSLTTVQGGMSTALVSGTAVASTSGTSIDFTGIPSWVKRITVMLAGVSGSGTGLPFVQIGSGSIAVTGYVGATAYYPSPSGASLLSTGFALTGSSGAASTYTGSFVLTLQNSSTNQWVGSGSLAYSDSALMGVCNGYKALSGALDRVRVTWNNGTDTFDAGSINILYE